MLAWGRKMLNEIHHRKLQFWYYSQQVIFYINFKQISTLFFCYFFPFVWSLSLQRNKVREGVAVPRFNASWVFHQHEKVADYFWLLWLLLKWCSCPSMVTVHVIFFFFYLFMSWHLNSLCLCEWGVLLIFFNSFPSLYLSFFRYKSLVVVFLALFSFPFLFIEHSFIRNNLKWTLFCA